MMFGSVRGRGGIRLAGVRISMEGWGGMPQGVALTPIIPPPLVNEILERFAPRGMCMCMCMCVGRKC